MEETNKMTMAIRLCGAVRRKRKKKWAVCCGTADTEQLINFHLQPNPKIRELTKERIMKAKASRFFNY